MQYLLDGAQMKAVERYNIEEIGIPSLALMERAAFAVADEAEKLCPPKGRILVVCGMGNNGADGLAAARMLYLHGKKVEIVVSGPMERATEEHRIQRRILEKLDVPVNTMDISREYNIKGRYDLIIDALFGIGLSRPLTGEARRIVRWINEAGGCGSQVLSVDIPTGVSSGTGGILGTAVRAQVTVTFGYEKLGMALYPGAEYAGRHIVADIGFVKPPNLGEAVRSYLPGEKGCLPHRPAGGNKGTFGRVFLAAGSAGMCGAAYLSGKAAYLSGAGLVQIHTVKENVPVLQSLLPEAVITVCDPSPVSEGKALSPRASVLVAGPGLSTKPYAGELLKKLLQERQEYGIPCILDADALNLLAEDRSLFDHLDRHVAVTPHMGEMARLTGKTIEELKADPVLAAKEFYEKYGVICVLKDARTVVASERGIYVNLSGNDGMATGGSGDVLSGLLGGLLAGGMELAEAAETGVYLHGLAGDAAASRLGRHAMLAGDILEAAGTVLHTWE
ncbi:MAG: NAD(P)H-hydrate dehydratase [Lachnospiraceae bacterium]|nr:NAD(P)H-hydrate dehydratase [Lachnospiraceae bacterium]